jgi:ribosomal-protein-alanine N-acetyltransferase
VTKQAPRRKPSRIRLRPMDEADLPQVVAIEQESFTSPWAKRHFERELLLPYSRSLVACEAESPEKVLGYVLRWLVEGEVELLNVAVARDVRRTGLGRRLIECVLRDARRAKATVVSLEVSVRNRAARALYRSLGFVEVRERKDYYSRGDHAVVMEWVPGKASL